MADTAAQEESPDDWRRAVRLLTGYPLPERGTALDALKGESGVPLYEPVLDRIDMDAVDVPELDAVKGYGTDDGAHYELVFYTTPDGDGAHDKVQKRRLSMTLVGSTPGGDGPPGLWSPDHQPNVGAAENGASAIQYVFGAKAGLDALLDGHTTRGLSFAGKYVANTDAVSLDTFTRTAQSIDRTWKFFVDKAAVLSLWEAFFGEEQAAWRGQAAGVFYQLVKVLRANYDDYADQLGGAEYAAKNTTIDSYTPRSTLADALAGAQLDLVRNAENLRYVWRFWEASGLHDPRRQLVRLKDELWQWLLTHNISQVAVTTQQRNDVVDMDEYPVKTIFYSTSVSFRQVHPVYGDLGTDEAWKRLGETAVKKWQEDAERILGPAARTVLSTLNNEWADAVKDFGSPMTTRHTTTLAEKWQAEKNELAEEEAERAEEEAAAAQEKAEQEAEEAQKAAEEAAQKANDGLTEALNNVGESIDGMGGDLNDAMGDFGDDVGEGLNSLLGDGGTTTDTSALNELLHGTDTGTSTNTTDTVGSTPDTSALDGLLDGTDTGTDTTDTGTDSSALNDLLGGDTGATDTDTGSGTATAALNPDGTVTTTDPDGTVSVYNPATGMLTTTTADGRTTTRKLDPETAVTDDDGDVTVLNPDGTLTTTHTDGSTTVTDPGTGEVTTTPADYSPADGATDDDDSSTDPPSYTDDDGGVTTFDPDGSLTTTYPDGTTQTFHPDGTVTTTQPDGTVRESDPDGTVTVTEPDGTVTVTTLNPDTSTGTDPTTTDPTGTGDTGGTGGTTDGGTGGTGGTGGSAGGAADDSSGGTSAAGGTTDTSALNDLAGLLDSGGGTTADGTTGAGDTSGAGGTGGGESGVDGTSYEDYDSTPYQPGSLGGPTDTATDGAGTGATDGSVPLNDATALAAGSASGTPMMPMGGMGGMGGAGGQSGQGGSGSERVRTVLSESDGASVRRRSRTRSREENRDEEERDVVITRAGVPTSGTSPFAPATTQGGRGGVATESGDRARNSWLTEDEDVWGTDEGGAPAVIG
ncbi:AAWKG family protein [Streptomyces sp. NPDC090106]|uniref:AAWKG family protein n=1 Tax=Streptomyces sp. NPDC090106 TaxID=3365946 RepID=UPI003827D94B